MYQIAPDGTKVPLVINTGGSGANFTNTTFDDEASTSIASGSAPFSGSYQALWPLAALQGKNVKGTWTLQVYNNSISTGKVNSWSVIATHATGGGALTASSSPAVSSTEALSQAEVQPLVNEAIARWEATSLTAAQVDLLRSVTFQIADLGGTTLGLESGTVITIDDNAAGWGWFVDTTPSDDSEFRKPGDQGEQNHMDLLTVVMHEMGHVLGLDHETKGVMQETLNPGTRMSPSRLDLYFAGLEDMADVALAVALANEAHGK